MTVASESSRRQLIPRWRPWRTTVLLHESQARTPKKPISEGHLRPARDAFLDQPSQGRAIELVTSALIHDERDEDVERAEALLGDAAKRDGERREIVAAAVAASGQAAHGRARSLNDLQPMDSQKRAATLRGVLRREPRNVVRWVDLAREFAVLGQPQKAMDTMRVALALAPTDRFVLRSGTALLSHMKDFERAVRMLKESPRTFEDPWLAAPAVAVSELAGAKTKLGRGKDVMRLVEGGQFAPFQVAELAAALGTRELAAGSERRGRQLLRRSLVDPTENALAQVEWLAETVGAEVAERPAAPPPRAWEAWARQCAARSEWNHAGQHATNWLMDQPFSVEAAIFGSFVFCEGESWTYALDLAESGLSANHLNPSLLNNKAFVLCELGRFEEAIGVLVAARNSKARGRSLVTLAATEGLLLMRIGLLDVGRQRYSQAIDNFSRAHQRELVAKASLMLAREEMLAHTDEAQPAWRSAERLSRGVERNDVRGLRARVEALSHPAGRGAPRKLERRLGELAAPLTVNAPDLEAQNVIDDNDGWGRIVTIRAEDL